MKLINTYSFDSETMVSDSSWFSGCNDAPCAYKKQTMKIVHDAAADIDLKTIQ